VGTAIAINRDGHVLRITLTRADRRNAFDAAMIDELTAARRAADGRRPDVAHGPDVRVGYP